MDYVHLAKWLYDWTDDFLSYGVGVRMVKKPLHTYSKAPVLVMHEPNNVHYYHYNTLIKLNKRLNEELFELVLRNMTNSIEKRLIPFHGNFVNHINEVIQKENNIVMGVINSKEYINDVLDYYTYATDKQFKYIFVRETMDLTVGRLLSQLGHFTPQMNIRATPHNPMFYLITQNPLTVQTIQVKHPR